MRVLDKASLTSGVRFTSSDTRGVGQASHCPAPCPSCPEILHKPSSKACRRSSYETDSWSPKRLPAVSGPAGLQARRSLSSKSLKPCLTTRFRAPEPFPANRGTLLGYIGVLIIRGILLVQMPQLLPGFEKQRQAAAQREAAGFRAYDPAHAFGSSAVYEGFRKIACPVCFVCVCVFSLGGGFAIKVLVPR